MKDKIMGDLRQLLSEKILLLQQAVVSARDSRDADTKSSAGDKHETSREMAQAEIDKLEVQLAKTQALENELAMIDPEKRTDLVTNGSLVFTNRENYFISIPWGKILIDGNPFYVISLQSPLGQALKQKQKGDVVHFQGREIWVEDLQ